MKFAIWLSCGCLILGGAYTVAEEPLSNPIERKGATAPEIPERGPSSPSAAPKQTSVPSKVTRYAQYLLSKYDRNRDGLLQKNEWKAMHGHPELIDLKGDGVIGLDDLTRWIANYGQRKRIGVPHEVDPESEHSALAKPSSSTDDDQLNNSSSATNASPGTGDRRRDQKFFVPSNRLPSGLPEWFFARDQDGDGQMTVGEFSPTGIASELAEFASYDANHDGVVTAKECVQKASDKPAATSRATDDPRTAEPGQSATRPPRNRRKTKTTP